MGLPRSIPLFPLPNVVLFPEMPLPLHVFEPRYRTLVADALDGDRIIGMTLLRPGWEADYEGRPSIYPSGCAGHIEHCKSLTDGRFLILLKGLTRFRIVCEHDGKPYRMATVEALPEAMGDPANLVEARSRVLAAIPTVGEGASGLVAQPELSDELFVNALSQSMDLAPIERQSLLDCDTILDRYRLLASLLELRGLERRHGGAGRPTFH